ncbi:tyrosine-protein kinase receptor UFO-like isoform X2 [Oscarella lobularis]
MRTSTSSVWDSEIVAEIGDLGVCPTRLTVEKDIGEGNFGRVYKCLLNGNTVAAKSAKSGVNVRDFIFEALRMKCLSHPNVMTLIGICWSPNPEQEQYYRPMILLPYMALQDLRTYLRKQQSIYVLSSPAEDAGDVIMPRDLFRLIQFGYQVAKGMEYLTGKMILHRDLAARNCMVDWDLAIKISDFGLARALEDDEDYYRITPGKVGLPIRWAALEGLTEGIFTTKSDVWSYGITLWEVMTMGMTPYPGVGVANLVPLLQEGMRLSQPKHCPHQMFNIMADCWLKNPEERPSFQVLVNEISELILANKAAEYTRF